MQDGSFGACTGIIIVQYSSFGAYTGIIILQEGYLAPALSPSLCRKALAPALVHCQIPQLK